MYFSYFPQSVELTLYAWMTAIVVMTWFRQNLNCAYTLNYTSLDLCVIVFRSDLVCSGPCI